jgi:DtxR family Mn-dependent transcriptional regulator
MAEALSASLEDYLEAILGVAERKEEVHVNDIAERLGVTMPSVTGALRRLAKRKLVRHQPYGAVDLTEEGRGLAEEVRRRHRLLTAFFENILGLDDKVAQKNACQMEHVMDQEALERLARYVEFAEECPLDVCTWQGGFGDYCQGERDAAECAARLEEARARLEADRKGGGMKTLTLDRIKPGQKAKIIKVRAASGPTNQRIIDMGVTRGSVVSVERVAPLGDPIEIKVKGYNLSLRKDEARGITVEPEGDK